MRMKRGVITIPKHHLTSREREREGGRGRGERGRERELD
jgi:hypothetical protein